MKKYLVVNADDFGASAGINRGILECHRRGVVTSTSLLVTGRAAAEAVAMSRDCPGLGVGLHWDVWGEQEDERGFNIGNLAAVHDEFSRQLDAFHRLMGRNPTHVDSHRHAHLRGELPAFFREMAEALGVPLRYDGRVRCISSFYAQWEWKVTNLEYVGVSFLQRLLHEEVYEGWTEILCHPGFVSPDFTSVYLAEREAELRTLTDPGIRDTIDRLGIDLVSYAGFPIADK